MESTNDRRPLKYAIAVMCVPIALLAFSLLQRGSVGIGEPSSYEDNPNCDANVPDCRPVPIYDDIAQCGSAIADIALDDSSISNRACRARAVFKVRRAALVMGLSPIAAGIVYAYWRRRIARERRGVATTSADSTLRAPARSRAAAARPPDDVVASTHGPCPNCQAQVRAGEGACSACGHGRNPADTIRDGTLIRPTSAKTAGHIAFSVLGPCYNCSTLGITSPVMLTFQLPRTGVAVAAMLCEVCDREPYRSWAQAVFPPPKGRAGHLAFQVIGICAGCHARSEMVADLTGHEGKEMAPMTCSAECEGDVRRLLDRPDATGRSSKPGARPPPVRGKRPPPPA